MKKLFLTILMLLCFSMFAEEYLVVRISGRVYTNNGAVSVGQVLNDNSRIVIKGDRDYVELSDNKVIEGPADGIVKEFIKNKIPKSKIGNKLPPR